MRRTIVIFCEGINSEPDYINGVKQLPHVRANSAVKIEISREQGGPLKLVEYAAARSGDEEVDQCWCVFDVEWPQNHPYLSEARELACEHNIRLAVSNPCFELWLILHLRDHRRFITTAAAETLSKQLDGRDGKHIDFEKYRDLRLTACGRAAALDERHSHDGTVFPHDNPSSGFYDLIQTLEYVSGRSR
jgi:RloB-like protein